VPEIAPLIQYGGAVAVLAIVFVLWLRGDIRSRSSVDAETKAIRERCETIAGELVEWKNLAKDAVSAQRQLAEALEVRNRIDEDRAKRPT
jgi:hypothetical protein